MRPFVPRKRQRLDGYDYRLSNPYFITFVTENRTLRFGQIVDGRVNLNEPGRMVDDAWVSAPVRHPAIVLDTHVVMPDHMHLLFHLAPSDDSSPNVSAIVQWFKTLTTKRYIDGVKNHGWEPFDGRLWKSGFHDRIVRDGDEIDRIRVYIANNPLRRWQEMQRDESARGALGNESL